MKYKILSAILIALLASYSMAESDGINKKKRKRRTKPTIQKKIEVKEITRWKTIAPKKPSLLETKDGLITSLQLKPTMPLLEIPPAPSIVETSTQTFPFEEEKDKKFLFIIFGSAAIAGIIAAINHGKDKVIPPTFSPSPEINPQVIPQTTNSIPEPSSFILLGIGLTILRRFLKK